MLARALIKHFSHDLVVFLDCLWACFRLIQDFLWLLWCEIPFSSRDCTQRPWLVCWVQNYASCSFRPVSLLFIMNVWWLYNFSSFSYVTQLRVLSSWVLVSCFIIWFVLPRGALLSLGVIVYSLQLIVFISGRYWRVVVRSSWLFFIFPRIFVSIVIKIR